MGVTVATVRAAATIDTPVYTQDFTSDDLGGLTPKAALFILTKATGDGVAVDDVIMGLGACDATNEWATCIAEDHGLGTTVSNNVFETGLCIKIIDPADGSEDFGEASLNSFIANGVRISWSQAPDAAYLITVVLFAGTDLLAHANRQALNNTALPQSFDITDPAFEPELVIPVVVRGATDGGVAPSANVSYGFVHNDGEGGVTQRSLASKYRTARTTTDNDAMVRTDAGSNTLSLGGGTDWFGTFDNFDANGFDYTINDSPANNQDLLYLALSFGGAVESWVGTHTTPTSTGNDSETGPSFTPQFGMMLPNLCEVAGTSYNDNRGGAFGISVFDADDEFCNSVASEAGVGTSNAQSLSDDRAIVLTDDDGVLDIEAAFVSFTGTGWDFDYTNAPATAKLFPALAIETSVAPPAAAALPILSEQGIHSLVFGGVTVR